MLRFRLTAYHIFLGSEPEEIQLKVCVIQVLPCHTPNHIYDHITATYILVSVVWMYGCIYLAIIIWFLHVYFLDS